MIFIDKRVEDVRFWFRHLKKTEDYVIDKSGCKMLEVSGATFIADERSIFGKVNEDYVERELGWYRSMSRNVNDIPGGTPAVWKAVGSKDGLINSNYGWMIWNEANHNQYDNVLKELRNNPESRRGVMIYTRPSMWNDFNVDGMSDFVCTNTCQYLIRDGKLVVVVQMRSNDVIFGYKNDKSWQDHVHQMLANDLSIPVGKMIWHVGSLHIYEKHFSLITS